jgi:hypothetical protein
VDADLETLTTRAARADAGPDALRALARAMVRAGRVLDARRVLAGLLAPGEPDAARAGDYLAAVLALGEGLGDPRGALATAYRAAYLHGDQRHLVTTGDRATELWDLETCGRVASGPGWGAAYPGGFPGPEPTRLNLFRPLAGGLVLMQAEVGGEVMEHGGIRCGSRPQILAVRPDASEVLLRDGEIARAIRLPGGAEEHPPPPPQGSVGQAWVPVGGCPLPQGGWLVEWVELPPASLRRLRDGSLGSFRSASAAALTHSPTGGAVPLAVSAPELAHTRQFRPRDAGAVRPDGAEFAHLVTTGNADGRELRLFALPELELRDTIQLAGPRHDHEGGTRQLDPAPVYVPGGDVMVQSGPWLARVSAGDGAVHELPSPGLAPPAFLAPRAGGIVAAGPDRVTPADDTGAPTRPALVHPRRLDALALSRAGDRMLTADLAGEVACWDLRAGQLLWRRPLAAGTSAWASPRREPVRWCGARVRPCPWTRPAASAAAPGPATPRPSGPASVSGPRAAACSARSSTRASTSWVHEGNSRSRHPHRIAT